MPKYISVTKAEYVSGFRLRLLFDNGFERVMDFAPFLKRATNPMFKQYRQLVGELEDEAEFLGHISSLTPGGGISRLWRASHCPMV